MMLSAWINIFYTIFVCVLLTVYWMERGPANFVWLSDIALFVILLALWMESRFLTSMMTVGVLLAEFARNLDFFLRLVTGFDVIRLNATGHLFESHYTQLFKLFSFLDYYGHSRLHFSLDGDTPAAVGAETRTTNADDVVYSQSDQIGGFDNKALKHLYLLDDRVQNAYTF